MTDESVRASAVVDASADVVFDVLADPGRHAAIDGTGRVRGALDDARLTAVGQLFRMAMQHEDHPDGEYETVNRVVLLDRPVTVAWETGYDAGGGELRFAGWTWRYDLAPVGPARTRVTLTYDWSAVPARVREYLRFPPFGPDHLAGSLAHLAALCTQAGEEDGQENSAL